MATEKTPNYSDVQVARIYDAIAANGGVANQALAESLAAEAVMNVDANTPRTSRMIIAKMNRMDNVTYVRKEKVSKSGKAIAKKNDLVAELASLVNADVAKLSGLDGAPKLALETLRDALVSEIARAA